LKRLLVLHIRIESESDAARGQQTEKHPVEVIKGKTPDLVLKDESDLKVVRCLFIEDYQKGVLRISFERNMRSLIWAI
jgi:hypothetical protein